MTSDKPLYLIETIGYSDRQEAATLKQGWEPEMEPACRVGRRTFHADGSFGRVKNSKWWGQECGEAGGDQRPGQETWTVRNPAAWPMCCKGHECLLLPDRQFPKCLMVLLTYPLPVFRGRFCSWTGEKMGLCMPGGKNEVSRVPAILCGLSGTPGPCWCHNQVRGELKGSEQTLEMRVRWTQLVVDMTCDQGEAGTRF